jgi:hypothetical protein
MVNGWLKSRDNRPTSAWGRHPAAKQAHFRHESCVNQRRSMPPAHSEVVLDQAILGLLINWTAVSAVGTKE